MPKPNYGFEKRQKEIAKQKKKEEKRNKMQQRSTQPEDADADGASLQDQDTAGESAVSTLNEASTADDESSAEGGET